MDNTLRDKIIASVSGSGAHVPPAVALEELTAGQARRRPSAKLSTIWEELAHIVFWQDFVLATLRGGDPQAPATAAGGWPAMPAGRGAASEWRALVGRFAAGIDELGKIARRGGLDERVGGGGKSTVGEQLIMIGNHTSYHLGQIVSLRRLIGAWPPPSGGATW